MKTKKLLARLRDLLDAEASEQRREIASIREVLKALKEKERKLQGKLEKRPDREDREEIEGKLQVIYAQRKKGVERVRELKGSGRAGSQMENSS
jgi:hypothetical protein